MGKQTKIEWADHTFSPWWGCQRVSPGCEHCYAEALSKRTGHSIWGPPKTTERRMMSPRYWNQPFRWNEQAAKDGTRPKVFPSMCDPFEDHPMVVDARRQFWMLIHSTPNLDWLLLTKRIENVERMVPSDWMEHGFPPNVWLVASTEDQQRANERIPILLNLPARVRGLSVEPQIERITLDPWLGTGRLHWVICGGESGAGARLFNTFWARYLRQQCQWARVPFFMKQFGSNVTNSAGTPVRFKAYKADDWNEWDEEFRVRQFPTSPALSAHAVQSSRVPVLASREDVNALVWGVDA